jgi:hypothetical protein
LRVFENRVLRRIFGPKRDEMTGGWRKMYSERQFHNLYFSPNIIRRVESRPDGKCSTHGNIRNA